MDRKAAGTPRRSLVLLVGDERASEHGAKAFANDLAETGVEIVYLGRETNPRRIAARAAETNADAIEACVNGSGGIVFLRDLLRELIRIDRRRVSIVVHRVY